MLLDVRRISFCISFSFVCDLSLSFNTIVVATLQPNQVIIEKVLKKKKCNWFDQLFNLANCAQRSLLRILQLPELRAIATVVSDRIQSNTYFMWRVHIYFFRFRAQYIYILLSFKFIIFSHTIYSIDNIVFLSHDYEVLTSRTNIT